MLEAPENVAPPREAGRAERSTGRPLGARRRERTEEGRGGGVSDTRDGRAKAGGRGGAPNGRAQAGASEPPYGQFLQRLQVPNIISHVNTKTPRLFLPAGGSADFGRVNRTGRTCFAILTKTRGRRFSRESGIRTFGLSTGPPSGR